jgi:hydrogenase maturation protein HypF
VEIEGTPELVSLFLHRLREEKPPHALIQELEVKTCAVQDDRDFVIRASRSGDECGALLLPDLGTCDACRREILDATNRRYHYPFTNCTDCGPRYTIIESLPYDRPSTSMKHFPMCELCQIEYTNPLNRRFHAQPNACPICGPQLELWDTAGQILATGDEALNMAASELKSGAIVALKGLGGFQLLVDASNESAVSELRKRKHRPSKPFALMYPCLELVGQHCEVSPSEEKTLLSVQSPIVLLQLKPELTRESYFQSLANSTSELPVSAKHLAVSANIAPGILTLGIMLPYTPLHHLLMDAVSRPLVATSGNISGEPLCINEREAIVRLEGIADLFLVHNRPILRPADDSVVRVIDGKLQILRRARGYAPLPLMLPQPTGQILAVGGQLKTTVAVSSGKQVWLSPHIGDLDTAQTYAAFLQHIEELQRFYLSSPLAIACDLHPDYQSTIFAEKLAQKLKLPLHKIQHHYAHILGCMAEHELSAPCLGIAWDGTGYGLDGQIWGGEALLITERDFLRLAHLRPFRLPGGEQAIREPRRIALGLLYDLCGEEIFEANEHRLLRQFSSQELSLLRQSLQRDINCLATTSMGRLFDAVSSLLDICHEAKFEGEAAILLEFAQTSKPHVHKNYQMPIVPCTQCPERADNSGHICYMIDWRPLIRDILADRDDGIPIAHIAASFHRCLSNTITAIAQIADVPNIALSGGCFHNTSLLCDAIASLSEHGFQVFWPQQFPPNDGGIALGQVMAVTRSTNQH